MVLGTLKLLLGEQTLIDNSLRARRASWSSSCCCMPRGVVPGADSAVARTRRDQAQRERARPAHARRAPSAATRAARRAASHERRRRRDPRPDMRFGGVRPSTTSTSRSSERELRCLIGPNGAGKSTFFKCLTGQIRLDHAHGRVFIRGPT